MKHTVRAFIIKDKKLLLVTGYGADFYWAPGGTVEDGETVTQALHRELKEELSVEILDFKNYKTYTTDDRTVVTFLVTTPDKFKVANEITNYDWYSTTSQIKPGEIFSKVILPDLISDNLIS